MTEENESEKSMEEVVASAEESEESSEEVKE